jgi:chromosome partitioning protein
LRKLSARKISKMSAIATSPFKVITLASRKGGTGKTTLAINLATIANRSEHACVVDMDPQKSTEVWKRLRAQDETLPKLSIGSSRPSGLPQLLQELRRRNTRWVFIDTPPNLAALVEVAVEHADLVLIPTRPDAFNVEAITSTIVLARQYKKPYVVIINEAPPLRDGIASPMVKEARYQTSKAAELYSGRIWKRQITHRNAISYALNVGHALNDRQSYEGAYFEFEELWHQVRALLRREQLR